MKPQDSFLTSEKFCAVPEFLKCLLACAAGGFVAYALKKGDIRSPFSLLCGTFTSSSASFSEETACLKLCNNPFTANVAKGKFRPNLQISFCKTVRNK